MVIIFSSCKVGRFVYYNFADITDYKIFSNRKLLAPNEKFYFHKAINKEIISSDLEEKIA